MVDLNMMMREQAKSGLQAQLDTAVTNGDTVAARKLADDLAKLELATQPAALPFTSADVWKAAEGKVGWLGVDPKKSATANEFAKTMNLKKFASAEAMADAIIKAVEEEYKPAAPAKTETDEDGEDGEGEGGEPEPKPAAQAKPKKTDGPETLNASSGRAKSGPWAKLADAPREVQAEIKRSADKFVPQNAPKEKRDAYISKALESHYRIHQAKQGKK